MENQGTNEDDSQSDPHPEAGILRGQTTQNSGPKDCRDIFPSSFPASNDRFLTPWHYMQMQVTLPAVRK